MDVATDRITLKNIAHGSIKQACATPAFREPIAKTILTYQWTILLTLIAT